MKQREGLEVIQCGYTFFKTNEEDDQLCPILIGIMASTGYAYGGAGLGKGAVNNRVLAKDMVNWLLKACVVGKVRLKSDGEPAVSAMLRALVVLCGNDDNNDPLTIIEESRTR
eukprot:3466749-Heterocapsa_arctica.AAC.1